MSCTEYIRYILVFQDLDTYQTDNIILSGYSVASLSTGSTSAANVTADAESTDTLTVFWYYYQLYVQHYGYKGSDNYIIIGANS